MLVQPMLEGTAELLAGVVQDPVFGPLVAFGPGGVLAELIGQAEFRIAPLTDVDAQELVTGGKAGTLVRGFRGKAPADEHALGDLVHRLGRLGEDFHELAELDLQPRDGGAGRLRRRRRQDPRAEDGAAGAGEDLVSLRGRRLSRR